MNNYDYGSIESCSFRVFITFPFRQLFKNADDIALKKRATKIIMFQKVVHDYLFKNRIMYRWVVNSSGLIIGINDEKAYVNFSIPAASYNWTD